MQQEAVATPAAQASGPLLVLEARVEHAILPTMRVEGEDAHSSLAERMAALRVPGLSVAVFDTYGVIWAKAYGVADLETRAPVTPATLFQAGSISKSVNALAVLQCASAGAFALDTPINDLLRSWKLPENDFTAAAPVTLRRLLSHTAGTTVHGFPGYRTGTPVPTLVQVLDGLPPANTPAVRVDLRPGSATRYSGGGISITQLVLVDTFAKAYPSILAERVLAPLGMRDSTYEQPLPPELLARAAAGHYRNGVVVSGKRHVYPEMAAAGLWTTAKDLAVFFREIALARANRSPHVSRAIALEMTTEVAPPRHSGLGVFLFKKNGASMFGHNGADEGFQSVAIVSLDRGYGVVMMANSDNGFRLFSEVERTVFDAMAWPGAEAPIARVALNEQQRMRWTGDFTSAHAGPFSIVARAERLFAIKPFLEPVELVAIAPNVLVHIDDGLRCLGRDDGAFDIMNGDGPVDRGTRLPAETKAPLIELAAGRFDAAVSIWKELLRRDPTSPLASERLHLGYGHELLASGKTQAATDVFRACVAVFPESFDARAHLADAYESAGNTSAALDAYQKAVLLLDGDSRLTPGMKTPVRAHLLEQIETLRKNDH